MGGRNYLPHLNVCDLSFTKKYFAFFVLEILFLAFVYLHAYTSAPVQREKTKKAIALVIMVNLVIYAIGFTSAIIVRTGFMEAFKIPSENMQPMLEVKDRLFVNKIIYKFQEPERGDVIVFSYPPRPERFFIKRLIAFGGETVEIRDGSIYINAEQIITEPISKFHYFNRGEYAVEGKVIDVPEGHYFVLGDNSKNSNDSRFWGFVPEENVHGKAFKIVWPLDRAGPIK